MGSSEISSERETVEAVAPAPILAFESVSKRFDDGTEALHDITLEARAGEMVSIVGPSGCGKSTLLRIASSLTQPTSGRVVVGSDSLGYVFQDATLLPWRTVRTNVELMAQLRKVPKAERAERVASAIRLVGLEDFQDHYPASLSGGMRMRVSLARALTLAPGLFLFDEPFGALDQITRERLNDELVRLFEAQRFGGLFITHSIQEAVFLSSRVIVMSERPGRILADVAVPFPYPRETTLRFEPAFAELTGRLSTLLREGEG